MRGLALISALAAAPASADALREFSRNCFSPLLTAAKAEAAFNGLRYDFYDLRPFSNVAPSEARAKVTPGTDRRCEVALDGDHSDAAARTVTDALNREGIRREAPVPDTHPATDGTALLAARYLNPNRIAVVHVGTRPGPNGIETFLNVERLTPLTE
ncbi:MAG: succinyl-CoA synthetase subunit beta [Pseudomonadota bacterium]